MTERHCNEFRYETKVAATSSDYGGFTEANEVRCKTSADQNHRTAAGADKAAIAFEVYLRTHGTLRIVCVVSSHKIYVSGGGKVDWMYQPITF